MHICDRCNLPTNKWELEKYEGLCKPCSMMKDMGEVSAETKAQAALADELFGLDKPQPLRGIVHRQYGGEGK